MYIFDVVFDFDPEEYIPKMSGFIDAFEKAAGARIKQEIETHFRDEYSMFSWILEGMLQRAGFDILERRSSQGGMLIEYFCRKNRDVMISSNSG